MQTSPHSLARTLRIRLELLLKVVCVVLIAALTVCIVWGVVSRSLGSSIGWYDEAVSTLLVWLSYSGAALAVHHGAHLGFDSLADALGVRARTALFVLTESLFIAFFVVLGWAGFEVIWVLRGETLTSLPWIPVSVAQSIIPLFSVAIIVSECLMLPEKWAAARNPRGRPAQHSESAERLT